MSNAIKHIRRLGNVTYSTSECSILVNSTSILNYLCKYLIVNQNVSIIKLVDSRILEHLY